MRKKEPRKNASPKERMQSDALELHRALRFVSNYRESRRGVPHIVVITGYETFSVCYFGKTQTYRVFWPYPSWGRRTNKSDFKDLEGVKKYIQEQTELAVKGLYSS